MDNCFFINNQQIMLTDAQVAQIQQSFGLNSVTLKSQNAGDVFKIGRHEFVVLEHLTEGCAVVKKDVFTRHRFGTCNNYSNSEHDKICNDFAREIADIIGVENIIEHEVDLISDDGLKDYGSIVRRAHSITAEQYRRWVEILDKHKTEGCYALATAHSTPTHGDDVWIKCVTPQGDVDSVSCSCSNGVRPFCILNPDIFVSK